jgi:hypothetical protein
VNTPACIGAIALMFLVQPARAGVDSAAVETETARSRWMWMAPLKWKSPATTAC